MQDTQETQVWSLRGEDPLEEGVVTLSSILAWRIPWTEEPVCNSPWGRQGHNWRDWACMRMPLLQKRRMKLRNQRWFTVSVQFSCSIVSDSLWPCGLQHARPPCPTPTAGAYSNSCPLSWWCRPTISSSIILFSSCLLFYLIHCSLESISSYNRLDHTLIDTMTLKVQVSSYQHFKTNTSFATTFSFTIWSPFFLYYWYNFHCIKFLGQNYHK